VIEVSGQKTVPIKQQFTEPLNPACLPAKAEGEGPARDAAFPFGQPVIDKKCRVLDILEHLLEDLAEGGAPPAIIERVPEMHVLMDQRRQLIEIVRSQRFKQREIAVGRMAH
jgi:hypothetical protein